MGKLLNFVITRLEYFMNYARYKKVFLSLFIIFVFLLFLIPNNTLFMRITRARRFLLRSFRYIVFVAFPLHSFCYYSGLDAPKSRFRLRFFHAYVMREHIEPTLRVRFKQKQDLAAAAIE